MKTIYHLPYRLNSFYKLLAGALFLAFVLLPESVYAIQLSGIYSSACEREIGIILHVDDTKVKVLNMDGEISDIRRFDIIYIAYYPMGKVSIPKVEPADDIWIADIKTLYKNQPVDLVKGWMTNYADNKISFLTTDGVETVIDTNDVWDISLIKQEDTIAFDGEGLAGLYYFAHPYPFAYCEEDAECEQTPKVSPHHLLGNPLLIKT